MLLLELGMRAGEVAVRLKDPGASCALYGS
jgi:hypothetical protein